jgi:AMP phosphorylase
LAFFLSARKLDIKTGDIPVGIINEMDAREFGIATSQMIIAQWPGSRELYITVDTTDSLVDEGEVGFFEDVWEEHSLQYGEVVKLDFLPPSSAVEAIRKKLHGKKLEYSEMYSIINDIAHNRLGKTLTTYYVSAGYSPGFDDQEVYYMTKALAETGVQLTYDGIVADKHSIGGVGGKGVTPIVIPIISCFDDITVPNTSTRAITSASATTDMLEVIMPMIFSKQKLDEMIEKNRSFMVWGGGVDLAPADDHIIQVQKKLGLESIDKFVASIVSKKIAQGVSHVVFDVPVGTYAKIHTKEEFYKVESSFMNLCAKFNIKAVIHEREVKGIDGNAIGPALECREFLRVFERDERRSPQLEEDSLIMAGKLLELTGHATSGDGYQLAKSKLESGEAFNRLRDVIEIQGGARDISSNDLEIGGLTYVHEADSSGVIDEINNKAVFELARALGNPHIKEAGIYFHKIPGEAVSEGDALLTLYTTTDGRMALGKKVLNSVDIFTYREEVSAQTADLSTEG